MSLIKVALVEDDSNWLKEMVKFISKEDDITVVGTTDNREDAIKLVESIEIDVILMDINLSGNKLDGIDVALEIHNMGKAKVIMLTSINKDTVVCDSFTAGAVNYISKDNYREIPNAIREAYKNKSPIEALVKDYIRLKEEEQIKDLSPSEKEVYALLEKGYTRTQIQEQLYKSENTLKGQIKNILRKLSVSSCREAIEKVRRKGL